MYHNYEQSQDWIQHRLKPIIIKNIDTINNAKDSDDCEKSNKFDQDITINYRDMQKQVEKIQKSLIKYKIIIITDI